MNCIEILLDTIQRKVCIANISVKIHTYAGTCVCGSKVKCFFFYLLQRSCLVDVSERFLFCAIRTYPNPLHKACVNKIEKYRLP